VGALIHRGLCHVADRQEVDGLRLLAEAGDVLVEEVPQRVLEEVLVVDRVRARPDHGLPGAAHLDVGDDLGVDLELEDQRRHGAGRIRPQHPVERGAVGRLLSDRAVHDEAVGPLPPGVPDLYLQAEGVLRAAQPLPVVLGGAQRRARVHPPRQARDEVLEGVLVHRRLPPRLQEEARQERGHHLPPVRVDRDLVRAELHALRAPRGDVRPGRPALLPHRALTHDDAGGERLEDLELRAKRRGAVRGRGELDVGAPRAPPAYHRRVVPDEIIHRDPQRGGVAQQEIAAGLPPIVLDLRGVGGADLKGAGELVLGELLELTVVADARAERGWGSLHTRLPRSVSTISISAASRSSG